MDGGSTDETITVLKSYPHLTWLSEPDAGQADALNKAISLTSGDYIGWLNSDDMYAADIFEEVAKALEEYPIVLGGCDLCDAEGKCFQHITNAPRSWFDLLKYWVPYSIPTQPSIFFRRDILDTIRGSDSLIFDSSLHYLMDYDLWLRIALHYPFTHRIDRVLSYYRMWEKNKTGQTKEGMDYAEAEMSRLFRRYRNIPFVIEYPISIIVPVSDPVHVGALLDTISLQSLRMGEIILASYTISEGALAELDTVIAKFNKTSKRLGSGVFARRTQSTSANIVDALNLAADAARGELLLFVTPETALESSAVFRICNAFSKDSVGMVTATDSNHWATQATGASGEAFIPFAIRKLALFEVDGIPNSSGSIHEAAASLGPTLASLGWETLSDCETGICHRIHLAQKPK